MPDSAKPSPRSAPPERFETLIETDDEIRRALLANKKAQKQAAPEREAPEKRRANEARKFRPTSRPPFALLTVCDDGQSDGEVIRIRSPRFLIGRTQGDLRIPLDSRISSRHVEITYQLVAGAHCWVVTDLQSRHGLFVRVSRAALADKSELLVGSGRYRFDVRKTEEAQTSEIVARESDSDDTLGWKDEAGRASTMILSELIGDEIGNRLVLSKPEYWIGTEPKCAICRAQDPFCDARHARLYRMSNGGWCADQHKSRNGLWLRMPQVRIDSAVQFQIGEQRFRLRPQ